MRGGSGVAANELGATIKALTMANQTVAKMQSDLVIFGGASQGRPYFANSLAPATAPATIVSPSVSP